MKEAPKQVIVMRKDLNMRKGKMVAQGAHASLAVILNAMHSQKFPESYNFHIQHLEMEVDSAMYQWINGPFKKICVSVDSEQELLDVYNKAKEAGLPCALITDSGLTEFNGVPTNTCCGIGPAFDEQFVGITDGLKLL